MKYRIKIAALSVFLSTFLVSTCSKIPQNNVVSTVEPQTYKSVGVVKSIDPEGGKVSVDHEDIAGYMSAMEMNESVADEKLLDGLRAGDKVEFEVLREGAKFTYTKFTKIGVVATADGAELYKTNCAGCHGINGEGAKKGIPLISGHALAHTFEDYLEQIRNGDGKKMPAFRDKLKDEEISIVAKYVREVIQKVVTEVQRQGHHH